MKNIPGQQVSWRPTIRGTNTPNGTKSYLGMNQDRKLLSRPRPVTCPGGASAWGMESSPGGQKTTSVEERLDRRDSMATLSMGQAREAASHMVRHSQYSKAPFISVEATVSIPGAR